MLHGISSESCDRRHEVIIAAAEARGFSLHEISRASQQHKQFGVPFDGVARVLVCSGSNHSQTAVELGQAPSWRVQSLPP